MPPSRPMTPEVDWAQIRPMVIRLSNRERELVFDFPPESRTYLHIRHSQQASYRDGGLDRRMRAIVDDGDVVKGVVEDRITRRQNEFRVWPRVSAELLGDLLDVVVVDVAVAAGPDEVADMKPGLRGHHVGEQCVASDVERHAEEQVGAALVQLAGQPSFGDVELEERVAGRQRHLRDLPDIP